MSFSHQTSSSTPTPTSTVLNQSNQSIPTKYFNNINEKSVFKKYINTKANTNKCARNNKCKKQTSKYNNKVKSKKSRAKLGLQTLSYGYKKKLINSLSNMIGFIRGNIKKAEIAVIATSLDVLNKVYNDAICESGITMSSESRNSSFGRNSSYGRNSIDIYQYIIKQMKEKLPNIALEKINLFINNIKNSNKSTSNTKSKPDTDYEDIMNNNDNLKKIFKQVLETLPECKK